MKKIYGIEKPGGTGCIYGINHTHCGKGNSGNNSGISGGE
jgi:hypothetical protein